MAGLRNPPWPIRAGDARWLRILRTVMISIDDESDSSFSLKTHTQFHSCISEQHAAKSCGDQAIAAWYPGLRAEGFDDEDQTIDKHMSEHR